MHSFKVYKCTVRSCFLFISMLRSNKDRELERGSVSTLKSRWILSGFGIGISCGRTTSQGRGPQESALLKFCQHPSPRAAVGRSSFTSRVVPGMAGS